MELGLQKLLGVWAMRTGGSKTCSRILSVYIYIHIYRERERDCRLYMHRLLTHVIHTIYLSVFLCTQTIFSSVEKSIYLSYVSICLSFLSHLACLTVSSEISSNLI